MTSPSPPPAPPSGPTPPPPAPPGPTPSAAPRLLRRSDTNRVAAGVAGGLGEYFGVDPVLFRVLFAVGAFFGGAGILAYLIAWAAIPERGATHAPIDRLIGGGRRSGVPVWVLTLLAVTVVWGLLFSWWAPWRLLPWMFVPLTLAVLVLAVALSRRPPLPDGPQPPGPMPDAPTRDALTSNVSMPATDAVDAPPPPWVVEARERRRRSGPVLAATFGALVVGTGVIAIVDATSGVPIPVYFWTWGSILLAGLVVGAALRRPIWWAALLLIPSAIGAFVFAGTRASLHDGSGANYYTPRTAAQLQDTYHHAFGRTTLDLTQLPRPDAARTVHVRLAAGEVRLIVPASLPVNVHANVHMGDVRVDGREDSSGMNLHTDPITTASAAPLSVDVQISAGDLTIDRSP
jgi:phage shock protein PspC (stress-responsive transcriptional regulator)